MPRVGSINSKIVCEIVCYIESNFGNRPFGTKDIEDPDIRKKIIKNLSHRGNVPNLLSRNFEIKYNNIKKKHTFRLKRD